MYIQKQENFHHFGKIFHFSQKKFVACKSSRTPQAANFEKWGVTAFSPSPPRLVYLFQYGTVYHCQMK